MSKLSYLEWITVGLRLQCYPKMLKMGWISFESERTLRSRTDFKVRSQLLFFSRICNFVLEREYENHQRFNHEQRHIVQSDIRLAKRAQSREEERARARGILTEAEKRQVEYRDRQIAEQYQQENIERYLNYTV